MIRRTVTLPEVGLIAGTRGVLGAGIGLLLAGRLSREKRSAIGWTLVAVGVLSTFPLLAQFLFGDTDPGQPTYTPGNVERDVEEEMYMP